MTTQVKETLNESLKKTEVEPLGELNGKADKADLCCGGEKIVKSGGESAAAEKEEPLAKDPTPKVGPLKKKVIGQVGEDEEDAEELHEENDYSSEDEEGDGEEANGEERGGEGENYGEEEDDEEYVDEGEEDDGDDGEAEPPSKRRK